MFWEGQKKKKKKPNKKEHAYVYHSENKTFQLQVKELIYIE